MLAKTNWYDAKRLFKGKYFIGQKFLIVKLI